MHQPHCLFIYLFFSFRPLFAKKDNLTMFIHRSSGWENTSGSQLLLRQKFQFVRARNSTESYAGEQRLLMCRLLPKLTFIVVYVRHQQQCFTIFTEFIHLGLYHQSCHWPIYLNITFVLLLMNNILDLCNIFNMCIENFES